MRTRRRALTRIALGVTLLGLTTLATADPLSDEERIRKLEATVAQLQKAQQGLGAELAGRVRVSGFLTAGATRHNVHQDEVDGDPVVYIDDTTDEVSYTALSRAGVQFDARLSDDTNAVVQILARGNKGDTGYDAEVQWAYFQHEINPSLRVRGGRLLLPLFMHSQYSNVGYAYHWADLPGNAYDIVPFDTMDGFDVTYDFLTGSAAHRLNLYMTTMDVPSFSLPAPVVYEVRDFVGINLTSTWGPVSTWMSYSHSKVSLDLSPLAEPVAEAHPGIPDEPTAAAALAPLHLDEADTYVSSVGMQYDNGSLLLSAERNELGIQGWFPTKWAGYISLGYRCGKWTPHLTWSAANAHGVTESQSAEYGGPAGFGAAFANSNMVRSKSWTLGARYDFAHNIALKAEVERFYDFGNEKIETNGPFSNRSGLFGLPGGIERDDPMVFRVTVDTVF